MGLLFSSGPCNFGKDCLRNIPRSLFRIDKIHVFLFSKVSNPKLTLRPGCFFYKTSHLRNFCQVLVYNKSTSLFNYPECLQDSRYTKLGSNLFLSKDHSSRIRRTDSESKRKRHSPCRKKTQAANNGLTLQTSGILQIEVLNIYCQVIQFVTF